MELKQKLAIAIDITNDVSSTVIFVIKRVKY